MTTTIHEQAEAAREHVYDDAIAGYQAQVQEQSDRADKAEQELALHMQTHAPKVELGIHTTPVDLSGLVKRGLNDVAWHRSYNGGAPATMSQHDARFDIGKRGSWLSIKPDLSKIAAGDLDSYLVGFSNSVPVGHRCRITIQHEAENPDKKIDPAVFVQAQIRAYRVIKSVRPDIQVGPIYMSGLFGGYPAPRDWGHWGVPAGSLDFLGVDTYNPYMMPVFGNKPTWVDFPNPQVVKAQQVADSLKAPLSIGECGSAEFPGDPLRKVGYTNQILEWGDSHNMDVACYFDSAKAGDTSSDILVDSSPQHLAFWNSQVLIHRKS